MWIRLSFGPWLPVHIVCGGGGGGVSVYFLLHIVTISTSTDSAVVYPLGAQPVEGALHIARAIN